MSDLTVIHAILNKKPVIVDVRNGWYSADSSVIDTVVCGGDILMQNRQIPGGSKTVDR
jgi:hypothetical protein